MVRKARSAFLQCTTVSAPLLFDGDNGLFMAETRENIPPPESPTQAPQLNAEQTAQANLSATPFEISVLPLQNTTLFPETVVPLAVGRPRSVAAVEAALATPEKLLACISARTETVTGQDATHADLYDVGTLVMVK